MHGTKCPLLTSCLEMPAMARTLFGKCFSGSLHSLDTNAGKVSSQGQHIGNFCSDRFCKKIINKLKFWKQKVAKLRQNC